MGYVPFIGSGWQYELVPRGDLHTGEGLWQARGCPGIKSPRPGHLKSLVWPAEGSRAPVAMMDPVPVPSSPHTNARLVITQMVFLTIFIKAFSSGQLSLTPKAHVHCPLYCPSPFAYTCPSSGLRDPPPPPPRTCVVAGVCLQDCPGATDSIF